MLSVLKKMLFKTIASSRCVGIDVGQGVIRAIVMRKHNSHYIIEQVWQKKISPQTIQINQINHPDELIFALKDLKSKLPNHLDAVIAVPGSAVMTKLSNMPLGLSDFAMERQAWTEIVESFGQSNENLIMDFLPIPESASNNQQEVLLMAARNEEIMKLKAIVEEAGFNLKVVDVDHFTLANTYEFLMRHQVTEDKIYVVCHFDRGIFKVVILKNFSIIYSRESVVGDEQISEIPPASLQASNLTAQAPEAKPDDEQNLNATPEPASEPDTTTPATLSAEAASVEKQTEEEPAEEQQQAPEVSFEPLTEAAVTEEQNIEPDLKNSPLESLQGTTLAFEQKATPDISLKEIITSQIRRALQFYYSVADSNAIDTILLSGNIAHSEELIHYISQELGLEVELPNPFEAFTVDKQVDHTVYGDKPSAFLLAVGLALRGVVDA